MKPFICRVGSKAKFAALLSYILPENTTYVEPFVGSGAVFFYKEPSEREVINDLDPKVVKMYRLIQKVSSDVDDYPYIKSLTGIRQFVKKTPKND